MPGTDFLTNFLQLSINLEELDEKSTRLKALEAFIRGMPGVLDSRIIDLKCAESSDREIFRAGLPEQAVIAGSLQELLFQPPEDADWKNGKVLLFPVRSFQKEPLGALLIRGSEELFLRSEQEFRLVGSKLRELLECCHFEEKLGELDGFLQLAFRPQGSLASGSLPEGLARISEGLQLPAYILGEDGSFIYANRVFLDLLKYQDLQELKAAGNIFQEPEKRDYELATIRRSGKVNGFRQVVHNREGVELAINDSAMLLGDKILGIFHDVTEFVRLNREYQEILEIQEFLSDRILETAQLLQKTQNVTIKSLARLAEYRDAETGNHLQRICEYSRLLARKIREHNPFPFQLSEAYVGDIAVSCMLHDIGKVGIPDSILLKPGRLTKEEWEIMRNHTTWGWELLNRADRELGEQSFLTLASTIALYHHERYDGAGYPNGLSGESIPLSARIVSIADVYDALTTRRPYKEAWPHEKAMVEIMAQKGTQFCPVLLDILKEIQEEFLVIQKNLPA